MAQMWYEKYRPKTLGDYVWTNDTTRDKLTKWINDPLSYPHLLLVGPTGTGKTTLALMVREMLGDEVDFKFIPAAMRNGVNTLLDEIVGFCEVGGFNTKVVVLDEIERLTIDAQRALRNVMDRYTDDVRFIFTANLLDRIDETVIFRMWTVEIDALDEDLFVERLAHIIELEDVDISSDASLLQLDKIVTDNYPNLRHAITALQMSVVDGVLVDTKTDTRAMSWENDLFSIFDAFSVHKVRMLVTTIRPDDFELVYRVLYENSEIFGADEQDAILVIAEQLYRHSQAGLPDITLCACLIKLAELMGLDG